MWLALGLPAVPVPAVADTVQISDDLGRVLRLASPPGRIVSLVPAATEMLFALGAGDRVVGRSRFARDPAEVLHVPSVGDGIRPSVELVLARRPDLVILFAGSDNLASISEFDRLGLPTLAIANNSFPDLTRNVRRLGRLLDRSREAELLLLRLRRELDCVGGVTRGLRVRSVYYDVWYPPPYTVGRGSYLDSLIVLAGGRNVFADLSTPSPRVSLEAILERAPEVIVTPVARDAGGRILPPAKRPGWRALSAVGERRWRPVDADLLGLLGPRVGRAAAVLAEALHPGKPAVMEALHRCERLGGEGG